jgi:hypothetical protein
MRFTILILAVALITSGCPHDPFNAPLAMMFLLIILAFGLGFDWHDQSAREIRNHAKGDKRQ